MRFLQRLFLVFWLLGGAQVFGFSLLGPFESWMTPEVGFVRHPAYDVGGPRNLGDEFRWNLPVLTYGFDEEFKDFFGTNGVAAVEEVTAWFNALPPAADIDLFKTVAETRRRHATAQAYGLIELRAAALVYLMEQMGVANSARFTWLNTTTQTELGVTEETGPNAWVIQRNFDPTMLAPSSFVNGFRFTYQIGTYPPASYGIFPEGNRIATAIQVDQSRLWAGGVSSAMPDFTTTPNLSLHSGEYFVITNGAAAPLTQDDAAGFKFLYHPNNFNMETLAPGVRAIGGGNALVGMAVRPGVGKILLQRFDPGAPAVTNFFEDRYLLNGATNSQAVERVIAAPDILFTVGAHTNSTLSGMVFRSGPNFSHTNANGPGVFHPGVTISFVKSGDIYRDVVVDPEFGVIPEVKWGVFNNKTVTPKIFPDGAGYQTGRTLGVERKGTDVVWELRLIGGVNYAVERSTNLVDWSLSQSLVGASVLSVTNSAGVEGEGAVFFRVRRTAF